MQAMTMSIGREGIAFFSQNLVANQLIKILGGLSPPDSSPSIPDFKSYGGVQLEL